MFYDAWCFFNDYCVVKTCAHTAYVYNYVCIVIIRPYIPSLNSIIDRIQVIIKGYYKIVRDSQETRPFLPVHA